MIVSGPAEGPTAPDREDVTKETNGPSLIARGSAAHPEDLAETRARPMLVPALLLSTLPLSQVNLVLGPAVQAAPVDSIIEITLTAEAASPPTPEDLTAIDAILSWVPTELTLIDATPGYPWFAAGFFADPDGINDDLLDGEALYTVLAAPGAPATVPPDILVATFRFTVLQAGEVSLLPTAGVFGRTRVLSVTPGLEITGDISATAQVDILFTAPICFGDPGYGTPCPCGNDNDGSVPGSGCANGAFASGAHLTSSGTASVSNDSLVLSATGLHPNNTGLYFQANQAINGGNGIPFGDGLRCAGGALIRLQIRFADSAGSSATTIAIATKGGVSPGDTKRYQCWYRDNSGSQPCGVGVNDFNLSNGYQVTWVP